MVRVTITPTRDSQAKLERAFDSITELCRDAGEHLSGLGVHMAMSEIADTFAREGLRRAKWQELADVTQMIRAITLGPSRAAHPILVRTGALRGSLTSIGSADNVVDTTSDGQGDVSRRMGTRDFKFEKHQLGEMPIPPRPMWPMGGELDEIMAEQEFELIQYLDAVIEKTLGD